MALSRGKGGDAAYRRLKARARLIQPAVPHPHRAQLKVEQRQRKRRDAAVAAQALEVSALCRVGFAAVGPQAGQGANLFKLPAATGGLLIRRQGFVVTPERLQDCCTLVLCAGILRRNPIGAIKVVERLAETMEYRAGACARHVGGGVGDRVADQAIGELCSPLVIADAPEDEPAKN